MTKMNGLSLRISGGGCKIKNPIGLEPVIVPQDVVKSLDKNELHDNFLQSTSIDNQLTVLKSIVNTEICDRNSIKFLVIVFLHAAAKHPVKSFLTRCITRNSNIQELFSEVLASEIRSMIQSQSSHYKHYKNVVSKLATCIENFPPGVAAVRNVELLLANYLRDCLHCCVNTLSENTLSPTEKNELFNLAHLTLRQLLFIVQKVTNKEAIVTMFNEIWSLVKHILFDEDAPMDTKSVCGMLLVAMHVSENGVDSWADLLSSQNKESKLQEMLTNDSAKLSLFSALATVVPVQKLHTVFVDSEIAVIVLIEQILAIGERMCSDSTFTLGVTRSLVHVSKSLERSGELGVRLSDRLLVFMWSHLEHHIDSVRHLTAQMLNSIVKYSAGLRRQGDESGVNNIVKALNSLDRHRKSFYLTLTSLTNELGAHYVMEVFPDIINEVVCVLHVQAVQASATTFLEVLLEKYMKRSSSDVTHATWVRPVLKHVAASAPDSSVLNVLESLLVRAVSLDQGLVDYMLPYISESCADVKSCDLKCVLMLLGVVRRARRPPLEQVVSYRALEAAAVHVEDETRILSLSLVVESPKSTEAFTERDLEFVLFFLKYNCNAQAPHFRQLMLSIVKKFIKRFEDSYKVLKRNGSSDSVCYLVFAERLRELGYAGLLCGANCGRRGVALQTLDWVEHVALEGYQRVWREEYVDRLLMHLEDSYESNKILALSVLQLCPAEMFQNKTYSVSLELEDILAEASSARPTDCTSAAYKLLLLRQRCPEYVLSLDESSSERAERVPFALLRRLAARLETQLAVCAASVLRAARDAPLYGLVHCMRYLLDTMDAGAISSDSEWTQLISRIIGLCLSATRAVACVVNNSSPEGHLPMDLNGVDIAGQTSDNVCLRDGRPVTAQMVLLCAWRTVKEVSLLLGVIASRLTIEGEGGGGDDGGDSGRGTLTADTVGGVGAHFTTLLAETKHRGAFEQAYVGFTMLLTRLWGCRSAALHELPRRWLAELLRLIESGAGDGLCATRRSAGLPYMIQALVITELQVTGNPKCFAQCMRSLLRLAQRSDSVEVRTHCTNILRSLYRNASLDDVVAGYVGEGLLLALNGFEGNTWQERNSSTLLFSALMVRIFGVARGRLADALSPRNRMTGRIFFLRYPALADFMLEKLSEADASEELLRPSVYPVLLLLARLYPSALEGTVSNLKLVSFIPSVLSCAGSAVLKTRQLAARAMVPLISPHMYISHMESMLKLISDRHSKRNYCHGIILQLTNLIEAKPDNLQVEEKSLSGLSALLWATRWVVEQTLTDVPCYLLTDDYVRMIDLLIYRFPASIHSKLLTDIKPLLNDILFKTSKSIINSGKDVCLANIVKLYLSILNMHNNMQETCVFIQKCLKHQVYEIVLVVLNYLLAIHEENTEHRKLPIISDSIVLLRKDNYIQLLCNILNSKYLECTQKALQLLVLENNTQHYIVRAKLDKDIINDTVIIESLVHLLDTEHENLTHIYLKSLTNYLSKMLVESSLSGSSILEAIRVIFGCAFSNNAADTRAVVVQFLETSFERLLTLDIDLDDSELFEYKATIWCTIALLLEDDEQTFRHKISYIITDIYDKNISHNIEISHVIPSKAVEYLMQFVGRCEIGKEILCVLALLDFKSEVCMNDEINDECRVFDTNERYNIFFEETVFTATCARALQQLSDRSDLTQYVDNVIYNPTYRHTFESLCDANLVAYKLNRNNKVSKNSNTNPKISLFIDIIST